MKVSRALIVGWCVVTAVVLLLPGEELPDPELADPLETALELAVHFGLFFGLGSIAGRDHTSVPMSGVRRRRILALVLAYCGRA